MVNAPKTQKILKRLRKEYQGSTQEEFGKIIGKGREHISKIEKHGSENVDVEQLMNALDWFKAKLSRKEYKKFLFRIFE